MTKLSNFPLRYRDAGELRGDEWHTTYQDALPIVNGGGIALFYGNHGTGKSRMAYEIAKKCNPPNGTYKRGAIVMEYPCVYTTAVELFMDIRDTYRRESEKSEKAVIQHFTEAALLVIDEIQERGETEFEDRKLTAIIDARYRDNKPTILISNYDRKRFASSLSPAVLDRIRENGKGFCFDWASYRGIAA